jgi:hypothetical protein
VYSTVYTVPSYSSSSKRAISTYDRGGEEAKMERSRVAAEAVIILYVSSNK